jgi:hypothetical protein
MVHFVGARVRSNKVHHTATHRAIYCQNIERSRNLEKREPQYVTTAVVFLDKYSELPEDGSMVNRNMSEPMTDF